MTDDQHGEGTPEGGGRWNPLPQGDYDDGATAFVKLPEGGIDALLSGDSPLAAPGHGYVPPRIPQAPAGAWPAAEGGGGWPDPNGGQGGGQWPDPNTGQGATQGGDRFTYDPAATQHWNFEEPAAPAAPGHDVTGQWSIPVAGGEIPDESGEFTTSSLVEQWGGTPPATLPGGAAAPWATNAGQPWGDQGETARGTDSGPDGLGTGEGYGAGPGGHPEGGTYGAEAGGHAEAYGPRGHGDFGTGHAEGEAYGAGAYDPGSGGHADFGAEGAEDARRRAGGARRARRQGRAQGAYEQVGPGQAAQDHPGHEQGVREQADPAPYGHGAHGQAGVVPDAPEQAGHARGAQGRTGAVQGGYGQDTPGRDAYAQGGLGQDGPAPGAYDGAGHVQDAYDGAGHAQDAHDHAGHAQDAYGQGGYEQAGQTDGVAVPGPHGAQESAAHGRDGRIEGPLGEAGHGQPGHAEAAHGQAPQAGPAPAAHPQGPGARPGSGQDRADAPRGAHGREAHEQGAYEQAGHPDSARTEPGHTESDHTRPGHPDPAHLPSAPGETSYPSPGGHPQAGHPEEADRQGAAAEHHTPPAGVPVDGDQAAPEHPADGPAGQADPAAAPEAAQPGAARDTAPDPAATPAYGTPSATGDPAAPLVPEQRSGAPVPGVPEQRSDTPAPPAAAPAVPAPAHDGDTPAPPSDAAGHADAAEAERPEQPEEPAPLPPHDDHPLASYVLRVNGADRPVTDAWIGESLLYVLRERLGLAGAKDGCSQGECGACNVQVDGRLVASCLVPAVTAAGTEVRTVEGLAQDGQPSDVQRALARCGAVQCGFCVPGMAMTVHDLLEGNPAPTELETRQALCGNLCRCSGYRGVVQAVQEVVAEREAAHATEAETDADADDAHVPHQAGHGVGPSLFEAPGAFDTPPPTPDGYGDTPGPYDQHYGQDGGQA
ncbi:2Fe-2S iron-sulfur cluster-binding protein [Streptomyces sp. KHY 26]|uniref:2Fe-2S iron-sulfur cluster-binding protein n=1 Tax=Streptomyces sp. KHY 26 TaxID=3097359 RepID=UPI00376F3677